MFIQWFWIVVSALVMCSPGAAYGDETSSSPRGKNDQAASSQDESPDDGESKDELARKAMDRLKNAEHWREALAAKKELAELGEAAADLVRREAEDNEDAKIRAHCYELLTEHFSDDPWSIEQIAEDGLHDQDDRIRYHCAWHCGKLKIYGAHRRLRKLMNDPKQSEHIRYAAAKSLAELGELDVIVKLIEGMQHDRFMPRHMANIGAKALTGRNLNDFGDYQYAEGAFVSGGNEYMMLNPYPAEVHAKIASRHKAIAKYCRWLEKKRPEVFKHLYAPY